MFYANPKLISQFGKRFKDGTIVFREGDPGEGMYVITRGKVKIVKIVDGKPQILSTLGEGQFFGEMAIINREPRSASAIVSGDSEILEIPAAGFQLLISKSPEIAYQIVQTFSERLRETTRMLDVLFHQDDRCRILLYLKIQYDKKQASGGGDLQVDASAAAVQLNMSVIRVQAALEELLRAEVIIKKEAGFSVPDPQLFPLFLRYLQEMLGERKAA
jgi:CRP-like cAMP-binding protein